ncbi:MAG: hypothetical protein LBV17_03650 [Treponema sp.]|jgi:hypothetical protein|nr:hypothetical protein [Treponema sp.]
MKNTAIPFNVSYELGKKFTWINSSNVNQRGWELNQEIMLKIAAGKIKYLIIVLDDTRVKTLGGLGGIEVIINSHNNGFHLDYKSFPWYWDNKTEKGGYTSYDDLLAGGFADLKSGMIHLKYSLTTHPYYKEFKKEMASAAWGQISIQYGIGIKDLPIVNAYLTG